jgi:hypothetical protein
LARKRASAEADAFNLDNKSAATKYRLVAAFPRRHQVPPWNRRRPRAARTGLLLCARIPGAISFCLNEGAPIRTTSKFAEGLPSAVAGATRFANARARAEPVRELSHTASLWQLGDTVDAVAQTPYRAPRELPARKALGLLVAGEASAVYADSARSLSSRDPRSPLLA